MQWLTPQWLSPEWLGLLPVLAVPILVHLFRRKAVREITFAAAHWLQQKPNRSLRRLQLRERALLCLRLMLLALLVVMLAAPQVRQSTPGPTPTLLVDPRVSSPQLQAFLANSTPFSGIHWLELSPRPVSEQRPAAVDLWRVLSGLAEHPAYRRAHILLATPDNPSGFEALRVSPHWQWHAVVPENDLGLAPAPNLALLGSAPAWLEPALQQLSATTQPELSLQFIDAGENPDPSTLDATRIDWLIYNNAGELPPQVRDFVASGGLLITDQRVSETADMEFQVLAERPQVETAALGRGSWLRYRTDWVNPEFFRDRTLPQQLWRDWFQQDAQLQARSRGNWAIANPPGIAVPDTEISLSVWVDPQRQLLLAVLLLLALERLLALSRGARRD